MCILSLLRSNEGFILTHNRDEDIQRKTSQTLFTKRMEGVEATYPVDIQSKGTWILTSEKFTTAILNGADHLHKRNPPYRHSRGIFPFFLLQYKFVNDYFENLDCSGIEPFTQIILKNDSLDLHEIKWNGKEKKIRKIEDEFYVTSSATLYNTEEKEQHKSILKQKQFFETDNLARMHHALQWTFKPELPFIKTTSITQVVRNSEFKSMKFIRMIKNMSS